MPALVFRKDAYTVGALVDAGIHPEVARKCVVAAGSKPERPRVALTGRRRGPETSEYVWGPDAVALLTEPAQGAIKAVLR